MWPTSASGRRVVVDLDFLGRHVGGSEACDVCPRGAINEQNSTGPAWWRMAASGLARNAQGLGNSDWVEKRLEDRWGKGCSGACTKSSGSRPAATR